MSLLLLSLSDVKVVEMSSACILYIISTIILQAHSFYIGKESNEKSLSAYESIEDSRLKYNIPAKNDTQIIREKISTLISSTKEDIAKKIKTIEKAHRSLGNNPLYKVGYIVNFLNSTYENIIDKFEYIAKHKNDWSVLKLLESYEQVKSTDSFVTKMVRVLNNHMSNKMNFDTRNKKKKYVTRIAWSYYDEDGQ